LGIDKKLKQKLFALALCINQQGITTNLSASMAEPSSNNCSITGTPDSAPDKRVPFRLQNSILCRLLFFFFTGGAAC
jgi:hypothetical protein